MGTGAGGRQAREFHDRTAHSPASIRASAHTLDWDNKPFPFKVYTDAPVVSLPRAWEPVATDVLEALAGEAPAAPALSLESLAALLYLTAGVTRRRAYPGGGEVLFRAAASTGALYQTEVYVVAGEVAGLEPGLYHFCPGDFTLRRLRGGDVRTALAESAADQGLTRRAATVVLTAIYWRNTWKYQARGFRHLYWDAGTMLANLLAVAGAQGLGPRLLMGFADAGVNRLAGLDADREAALALVALGPEGEAAPPSGALPALALATLPLSGAEVDYPLLRAMQRASGLDEPAAVEAWRRAPPLPARGPGRALLALPPPRPRAGRTLHDTIQHRGSTRRFSHAPLVAEELATALWAATRPLAADVPSGLVDLYLAVHAVDGIPPGAYAYWPEAQALEPLGSADLRRRSAHLCLEQALGGDASATIFFLASLDAALGAWGDRGYRAVNLEAGLGGGRAYLAAYGQRFGATGLTFYDAEVVGAFSPHARGKDAIFVTALGRAWRPRA